VFWQVGSDTLLFMTGIDKKTQDIILEFHDEIIIQQKLGKKKKKKKKIETLL
jgi:hypothetical protein